MGEESQAAPAGEQPSAASSSAAEGAAGGEGGGSMPLIIGGVVVLLLLGGIGAFVALSGKKEADDASSVPMPADTGDKNEKKDSSQTSEDVALIDPTNWTYHGVLIGKFENPQCGGLDGKVYAATKNIICVTEFKFDGTTDAVFLAGTADPPDWKGDKPKDITKKAPGTPDTEGGKLRAYDNEKVVLELPKDIKTYQNIAVYSETKKGVCGHVVIKNFEAPQPKELPFAIPDPDPLVSLSGSSLLNSKEIKIKDLEIKEGANDVFVIACEPTVTEKEKCQKLQEALKKSEKKDMTYTLVGGKTWDKYQTVEVYDFTAKKSLATCALPEKDKLTVPVAITPDSRRRRAVQRRVRLGNLSLSAGPVASKPKMLACTFGEFGVRSSMVPPDGMCDVVFYTDVEYDNDNDGIVPRDGGPAFGVLKSAAKKYTKTTFGTSMSVGTIAGAVKEKANEVKASMDEMFNSRLVHFGMLNVENIEDYNSLKNTDLKYLKVVAEFLKTKMPRRHYHSALGISLRDASRGEKILEVAKRAPRDFPGLTMVVVKLHTENVAGKGGDTWPVAPNPDGVDLTDHNALSLAIIKDEVKRQLLDIAGRGRYAMLSFAMYARTYHMKASWNEVSVREASESSLNMDYASVCKMEAEKDSSDSGTMYAADQDKKFLALFDSPATFKTKTKDRLGVMPKNFTGLVVYNVEMDDYKGACGKGRFARLRAIKAALGA